MVKILVYRNFITEYNHYNCRVGNVLQRQQQVRHQGADAPLTEGCSGYSRFTRPWTEYFYGKLLEDADIGVGEDYRNENSMITKTNGSVS